MERVLDVFRGFLIGLAETVPGISGGTIALVLGIYESLITSAGHFIGSVKAAATGNRELARDEMGRVQWVVVLPVLAGMAVAIVVGAKIFGPLVEDHESLAYATFLGMTVATILIPLRLTGWRWSLREAVFALVFAVGVFLLVGLPPSEVNPNPVVIFAAAAVAICALALPGVSGSFLLLTFGLYSATLTAVNDRDIGYLATFALGAVVGLALFVRALQRLLEHHRRVTLVALTGVLFGAMRALWPWQTEDRSLLAPGDNLGLAVLLFLGGALAVLAMERLGRLSARN